MEAPLPSPTYAEAANETKVPQSLHQRSRRGLAEVRGIPVGSVRPNLSRACQKTKLCAFHVRGYCERGMSCNFAHGEAELKTPPDLQRTRLCPAVLRGGECLKRTTCKFAHTEEELQPIEAANEATQPFHVPPSFAQGNSDFMAQQPIASAMQAAPVFFAESPISPQYCSKADTVCVAGMMPPMYKDARLLQSDIVHWYHQMPHAPGVWLQPGGVSRARGNGGSTPPTDSDVCSQRSTEEGLAEEGESDNGWMQGSSSGSQTPPTSSEEGAIAIPQMHRSSSMSQAREADAAVLNAPSDVEVTVRNTFLHFGSQSNADSAPSARRRGSSAPGSRR